MPELSLLLPEWQGYGVDGAVADGARALARALAQAQAAAPTSAASSAYAADAADAADAGHTPHAVDPAHAANAGHAPPPTDPAHPADAPNTFVIVDAPPHEPLAVEDGVLGLAALVRQATRTFETLNAHRPSRIFTIGGTCGAELGPVGYLNQRYRGDLAVVWLDAHADLNTPATSPSAHFHGMVLRTLLGDGPSELVRLVPRRLGPEQIVLAGVRDLDRDEAVFVSDAAISRLGPADLLVPDRVTGRVRATGFTKVYIHLDLDVLDPKEFPDALMRTPGGVSTDQLVETIQHLDAHFDVVGFSVVEFRPRTDDAVARAERLVKRCGIGIGAAATR